MVANQTFPRIMKTVMSLSYKLRVSVIQKVVEYLMNNIENGTWPAGEKIPSENCLTRILGVSRASVRVAIQQFVGLGVLQSVHGKGTFVKNADLSLFGGEIAGITSQDCRDMRKVMEFRRIVEPEAGYLACSCMPLGLLEELALHLENMIGSVGEPEEFVREDILFHECIARASGNPLLEKSLREIFKETVRTHAKMNAVLGYKDGIYYHSIILKAFRDGNAKQVRSLMSEHLQSAIERLVPETP